MVEVYPAASFAQQHTETKHETIAPATIVETLVFLLSFVDCVLQTKNSTAFENQWRNNLKKGSKKIS